MAVLLDTDVAIELLRRNTYTLDCLAKCEDEIFVSTITAAELYFGAYHSQRIERNVRAVDEFLRQFPRLTLTDESSRIFGEQKQRLRENSAQVDTLDLLIASLALANNCCIVTGNTRHFKNVKGLQLQNWIAEKEST